MSSIYNLSMSVDHDDRISFHLMKPDGCHEVFRSPGTLGEINEAASRLITVCNGLLGSWSEKGTTRDEARLLHILRTYGNTLSHRMFDKEAQSILLSEGGPDHVLVLIDSPWQVSKADPRPLRNWPWNAILMGEASKDDYDGKEEHFLGTAFTVVTPNIPVAVLSEKLDSKASCFLVEKNACQDAREMDTAIDIDSENMIESWFELSDPFRHSDFSVVVCRSDRSRNIAKTGGIKSGDDRSKATEEIEAATTLCFTAEYDSGGSSLGTAEAEGLRLRDGALLVCVACKVGLGSLPQAFALHGQGCIMAPHTLMPADLGIRLGESLIDVLDQPVASVVEVLREWQNKVGPISLLFSAYGNWTGAIDAVMEVSSDGVRN